MSSPLTISAEKTKKNASKIKDPNSGEEARLASTVPDPVGYKILVLLPITEEKTDGGVWISEQQREREGAALQVGYVLKMGADCYTDKDKFPTGPWCKEGDFVVFRSYAGTRFKIEDNEFRLMNDDTIDAVVEDPRGLRRV